MRPCNKLSIYVVRTYCKYSNISQDKSTNDSTTFAEVFEYLSSLDYSTKYMQSMLTYFAIGIAVRPLLPSGYFLWLSRKSFLFINDDGDPFRIKELPRDFETIDTAFDVTTIFTSKQTLRLALNDKTVYFKYTTNNYYCQDVKMVSVSFIVYIYRDTHKP